MPAGTSHARSPGGRERRRGDAAYSVVVGAASKVGGPLLEPGVVAHTLLGTSCIGELPTGISDRGEALAADLRTGGTSTVAGDRIRAIEPRAANGGGGPEERDRVDAR